MGKIFCLMGKSASGKDTIYGKLMQQEELQLTRVVPYTTRPIRSGEVEGETYYFTDETHVKALEEAGRIIELRSYDTVHGVWKYFTADDGQIDLTQKDYLMIGTLEAYEKLCAYFGRAQVCPIYVWLDDGLRLERALSRERMQAEPKYEEMCRRFLADAKDFSAEKVAAAGILPKECFENTDMDTVIGKIVTYVREQKGEPA